MKKKVLFTIDNLGGGGAERILINILKNIDSSKYEVDLICIENTGIYLKEIPKFINYKYIFDEGKQKYLQNFSKLFIQILLKKFRKLRKNKNYDVEISFLERFTSVLVASGNSSKIGWVHLEVSKIKYKTKFHEILGMRYLKALKKMDKIICVSKTVKEDLITIFPELEEKIEVIYNPNDYNCIFKKLEERLDENHSLEIEKNLKKGKVFLSTGRIVYDKGFDRLIEVSKILKEKKIECTFLILGQGKELEKYKQEVKEKKVEKYVKFLGFSKNPYIWMKKVDAFLMPSRIEGLPTVLIEALCLGIPILTTNVSGAEEIIGEYKKGYICNNNFDELYQMIESYIEENIYYRGKKENIELLDKFGIEKNIKQIENIIDGLLLEKKC